MKNRQQSSNIYTRFFLLALFAIVVSLSHHRHGQAEAATSSLFCSPSLQAQNTVTRWMENCSAGKKFYIQGWRWHTLSLVRDLNRLERLAQRLLSQNLSENFSSLDSAARHVVDFNMRGLHRIENDLFFPWLRKKAEVLQKEDDVDAAAFADAFRTVIDEIDKDQHYVSKKAKNMRKQASIAASSTNQKIRIEAANNVKRISEELCVKAREVMDREERCIVPVVAAYVSPKEQKSFNNKVIRKLGILDSRLHLVGMRDAVWDASDRRERVLFEEAIPKLPRMMIPRWRRLLYEPQAGVLDSA